MKNQEFKLIVKGDYAASNYTKKGSKKEILTFLRDEAHKLRRSSRLIHNLPDNVHSIDDKLHQSKLVTMASFKLSEMNIEQLLTLLNNHGVYKYQIK